MKPLILAIVVTVASGCASQPATPCNSLNCMFSAAEAEIARTCEADLSRPTFDRRVIKAVFAQYRYPLTNMQTYLEWTKMGNKGPSPWEWCARYAKHKVRSGV